MIPQCKNEDSVTRNGFWWPGRKEGKVFLPFRGLILKFFKSSIKRDGLGRNEIGPRSTITAAGDRDLLAESMGTHQPIPDPIFGRIKLANG